MNCAILLKDRSQYRLYQIMPKFFNSGSSLIVATMFLVAGGLTFQKSHRASAARLPHTFVDPSSLTMEHPGVFNLTNADFAAQVNLWKNPGVPVYDTDFSYANYMFHSTLNTVDFAQLATRTPDNGQNFTLPVTMSGGHFDYAHFSIGDFKANLTLTPLRAKPDDFFPTLLKPGVSGSFNF
jgi:hypothetical protein